MNMHLDHSTRAAMLDAMPNLRRYARSLCRDADKAEDLTQETLLRAFVNIDKFRAGSSMVAWLISILRNQHYTAYRKQVREVEDIDGTYADTLVSQPDQIARVEYEELRAALAELPKHMREALLLVTVDDLSYEQAARICGCSVGTVKSRVHRARAQLAAMLSLDAPTDVRRDQADTAIVVRAEQPYRPNAASATRRRAQAPLRHAA
jgi:RNA polymerase sigma-70 factor, ECF subfamily